MDTFLESLTGKFRRGEIDRRDFMRGAMSLGLTVTAASMLASSAEAQTPKKGGRFRLALAGGATSDSLDPATILDTYMLNVTFGQTHNCLTEIDADGQLIGELAESWEASTDAKQWVFRIRNGIEFHNGKTMDATDVVESLNHHRGEGSESAAAGLVASIADIKVDGPDLVVVTLDAPSADFAYLMSDYHLLICPAKPEGGIAWEEGVGTGGYRLSEFEPGVRTLTIRNPNYWKEGRAHFDEIETFNVLDATGRTSSLVSGKVDLMYPADLKTVDLLSRALGVKILESVGNKHVTLPMLTDTAPFDNKDVRLALKHAIDREQWLSTIFGGHGQIGNDHPIGPANQYRATELAQRAYDPDKARFHLKQAGLDSLDVTIHVSDTAFTGATSACELYQESAKLAGINIEINRAPEDGYWSNVWLAKPWCVSYWGGRPTEDWMFSQVYAAGADWNETKWSNDRFMMLLEAGRAELDPAKRREIYTEMQAILNEDGGAVVPIFTSYLHGVSDKIAMPETIGNNWELDGEKATERWWFA